MASFVIHTIVGEKFLDSLENLYNISISDYDKKQFLLGNLIVDSIQTAKDIPTTIEEERLVEYKMLIKNKIRKEKLATHFRDITKEGNCIKIPEPELFISEYYQLLMDNYSVLGYLFHLYTDKIFFSELFPKSFDTLDSNGQIVTEDKELVSIRIKKDNIVVDAKEFWAGTGKVNIYKDYTVMNRLLLERFGTSFDAEKFISFANDNFENPGIEEVAFRMIDKILCDTQKFITESYQTKGEELSVFKKEDIIEFVPYVVEKFIQEYKSLLDQFYNTKKKTK